MSEQVSLPAEGTFYMPGCYAGADLSASKNLFVTRSAAGALTVATSGFALVLAENAANGADAAAVFHGWAFLKVNAQSVNIGFLDPIKPTTAGVGIKADTNRDKYSAIAAEAATADGVVIMVFVLHGTVSST